MSRRRKDPKAVALGRKGGSVSSEAKTRAAKRNAKKGGRPPKFMPGDRVIGRESARAAFRGRAGTVIGPTHNRAEWYVEFDDRKHEPEAVFSWWIDKT